MAGSYCADGWCEGVRRGYGGCEGGEEGWDGGGIEKGGVGGTTDPGFGTEED